MPVTAVSGTATFGVPVMVGVGRQAWSPFGDGRPSGADSLVDVAVAGLAARDLDRDDLAEVGRARGVRRGGGVGDVGAVDGPLVGRA